jgi:hypothetical protein
MMVPQMLTGLQTFLLQSPQQHIEAILTEKRRAFRHTGWHTPMARMTMINLVFFDHRVWPLCFSDNAQDPSRLFPRMQEIRPQRVLSAFFVSCTPDSLSQGLLLS